MHIAGRGKLASGRPVEETPRPAKESPGPGGRWEGAAVVHTPEEEREELDEELVEETMRWRGCARGWAWWSLSDACWEQPIFCNRSGDLSQAFPLTVCFKSLVTAPHYVSNMLRKFVNFNKKYTDINTKLNYTKCI
jgi:hypothetical protein